MTRTKLAWRNMKARCANLPSYTNRGIKVCERWANSFSNFLADMGESPSANLTLERIDNNGDYTPTNCKWATYTEQNLNKRLYRTNTTGVKGVRFLTKNWTAEKCVQGIRSTLYYGPDFFEACCARKAWDLQRENFSH